MLRPFQRGVHDPQDDNHTIMFSIDNNVWQAGDNKFPGASHPAGTATAGVMHAVTYFLRHSGRCRRTVCSDVFHGAIQVNNRLLGPANPHSHPIFQTGPRLLHLLRTHRAAPRQAQPAPPGQTIPHSGNYLLPLWQLTAFFRVSKHNPCRSFKKYQVFLISKSRKNQ